jgi:hypothetical protein
MVRFRRIMWSALGTMLAFVLVATTTTQSASAFTGSPVTVVRQTPSYCVKASATVDHYSGGFSGNIAYANGYLLARMLTPTGLTGCDYAMTGDGRARVDVQVWNGSAWVFCRGSDWRYGTFGWSSGELGGPYGPQQLLDYGGSSSCGQGYYRAVATAEAFVNGSWVGGSVASGYEFVP